MTRANSLPGCIVAAFAVPIVLLGLAAVLTGCGGPPAIATTVTVRTGAALHETDLAVATALTDAADRAIAAAEADGSGFDGYARRMAPWSALTDALEVTRQAWLATDRALSAWEAGDDGGEIGWMRAAACMAGSLAALTRALTVAGVPVPASIADVAEQATDIAGALCAPGAAQGTSAEGHSP